MKHLVLEDLSVTGKKVLLRVDFNVPIGAEGVILDASRIEAAIPTIRYLLQQGAALILMSHLGRPGGLANPEYSLKVVIPILKSILDKTVHMAPDCVGFAVKSLVDALKPGDILLLENLRFHRAEEYPEEDPEFAKTLASYGDFYVNDAFGTAHRVHSSTVTITQYFPQRAAAGYLLQKEMKFLGELFQQPARPFLAILGGGKVSTKLGILRSLIERVDGLLIGGAMAYTFLKAQGAAIGNSPYEEELIPVALELVARCKEREIPILLPIDFVVARSVSERVDHRPASLPIGIPTGYEGVDIGPQTIERFKQELKRARTILWNGPLGVFEIAPFAKGTYAIAQVVGNLDCVKIAGGGDLLAAIHGAGTAHLMTHLSTGGGATLEYIEHTTLPAIDALSASCFQTGSKWTK